MALAKTAFVASSVVCTACVAAALALPTAGSVAKTVNGEAHLAATYIDFAGQDAFSALPFYAILNDPNSTPQQIADAQANLASISAIPFINQIQAGDRTGFYGLASTNATQAFDIFQNGLVAVDEDGNPILDEAGNPVFAIPPGSYDAFVPSDLSGGYSALSGVSTLQAYQNSGDIADLAGIDAYSAIPAYQRLQANDRTALYDLASTNGTQSFDRFQAGYVDPVNPDNSFGPGDFAAFVPTDPDPVTGQGGNQGYAALSGVKSIQNYLNSNGDLSQLNGIDAFSSIQTVPEPAIAANDEQEAAPEVQSFRQAAPQPEAAPAVEKVVTPVTPPPAGANNKQNEVRSSANYSPAGLPVLFGSGKGKGPDSGIAGWGKVADGLRGALGMGPDTSGGGETGGGDTGGAG